MRASRGHYNLTVPGSILYLQKYRCVNFKRRKTMEKMFELLKQDHREVSQMITELKKLSGQKREKLFQKLSDALQDHMTLEEDSLYPALEDIDETKDLIEDAYEEHKTVQKQLKELDKIPFGDKKWDSTLNSMEEKIEHHVQEEESKLFKIAPKVLSTEELEDLNDQIVSEKERKAA